jgi:subtilase family serine protease
MGRFFRGGGTARRFVIRRHRMAWMIGGGVAAAAATVATVVVVNTFLAGNEAEPPALAAPTLLGAPCAPPPTPCTTTSTIATFEFQLPQQVAFHALAARKAGQDPTFHCALDQAAAAPCDSPITFRGLSEGVHRFSVQSFGAGGEPGRTTMFQWEIVPPPPGAKPDLVIDDLQGDRVTVTNQGEVEAGPSVVDVTTVGQFDIEILPPQESQTVRFPRCVKTELTAIADRDKQVDEANERNNRETAGPFDCLLPDLVVNRLNSTWVTVKNQGPGPSPVTTVSVQGVDTFNVDPLTAGESFTANFQDCERGRQLTADVDPDDTVKETDDENNSLTRGPFDDCPLPDLRVSDLTQNSVTVSNDGDAAVGPSTVAVTDLGTLSIHSLAPGDAQTVIFEACTEGSLTATADAIGNIDESNEDNNSLTRGPFTCPLPDLVVTDLTNSTATVSNRGDGPAGPSTVTLGELALRVGALQPGDTASFEFDCQPGEVIATADAKREVRESDEENNVRRGVFRCPKPDLVVADISGAGVVVRNAGDAGAGPSSVGVTGLGTLPVSGLAAGQSTAVKFSRCPAGDVTATADSGKDVDESNEGNNSLERSVSCPDLVISHLSNTSVAVQNAGNGSAPGTSVSVRTSSGPVGEFSVSPLGPGQVDVVDFSCQDASAMAATSDSSGRALESNEGNNGKAVKGPFSCLE